jgi:polysaccharide export outer membrane protein
MHLRFNLSFLIYLVISYLFLSGRIGFAEPSLPQVNTTQPVYAQGDYVIGVNDLLEVQVYGEESLTQEVQVTTDGYISYPFLGRIKAAGLSVTSLEDYIRTALAKDYIRDPQVKIVIREFSNIFVFGQVKEPGPYLFKGGMTVLQAITTAGGFTKIASPGRVRIVRERGD